MGHLPTIYTQVCGLRGFENREAYGVLQKKQNKQAQRDPQ